MQGAFLPRPPAQNGRRPFPPVICQREKLEEQELPNQTEAQRGGGGGRTRLTCKGRVLKSCYWRWWPRSGCPKSSFFRSFCLLGKQILSSSGFISHRSVFLAFHLIYSYDDCLRNCPPSLLMCAPHIGGTGNDQPTTFLIPFYPACHN